MSITEIIRCGGCSLLLLLTLVQIAPIKINPWSWIARNVGKAMTGELENKVDQLANKVNAIHDKGEEREADNRRVRILRFNDEIVRRIKHTKEHFQQILIDVDWYESYCDGHLGYKNNMADDAIDRIKRTYKKCGDENSFL